VRKQIDTAWFQDQATKSAGSIRKLARLIIGRSGPLDPAALVRAIHGQREFTLSEIKQIAHQFQVPILEVLRRCGINVDVKPGKKRNDQTR